MKGLGRGLDALLANDEEPGESWVADCRITLKHTFDLLFSQSVKWDVDRYRQGICDIEQLDEVRLVAGRIPRSDGSCSQ